MLIQRRETARMVSKHETVRKIIQGLTEQRLHCMEVGPESLKLMKLGENNDIEDFLTKLWRPMV